MKKYFSVIILLAMLALLIHRYGLREWLFLAAALLASYLLIFIIERYRKLTSVGRYLVYMIVAVPIMANVIPVLDLVVLTATGLATTIYHYDDEEEETKQSAEHQKL